MAIYWYLAGVPINAAFMFYYLHRRNPAWVFNAAGLVWCVGSVVRLWLGGP